MSHPGGVTGDRRRRPRTGRPIGARRPQGTLCCDAQERVGVRQTSSGTAWRGHASRHGAGRGMLDGKIEGVERRLAMYYSLAAARYAVVPLPFIPFSNTGGEALNNKGVVAGGIANSDGSVSLAQWCEGVLTDLGVPPGLPSHDFNRPRVFGMSHSGSIVGTVHTAAGDLPSRWFIYEHGRFTVLPLADPTDVGGAAIGINSRGQVVGYDHTSTNNLIGWLWFDGVYSRLGIRGTNTAALGINSNGTIIGNRSLSFIRRLLTCRFRCTGERGYVFSDGVTRYLTGFVYAINDLGEAAGGSISNGQSMATVFKNGIASVILSLPSYAVGINASAHVVGFYQPSADHRRHLFIWSASSGVFDLTPGGYVYAEAAAINDRGDVLGFGETADGKSQYFLLTPDPRGMLTPKALGAAPSAAAR